MTDRKQQILESLLTQLMEAHQSLSPLSHGIVRAHEGGVHATFGYLLDKAQKMERDAKALQSDLELLIRLENNEPEPIKARVGEPVPAGRHLQRELDQFFGLNEDVNLPDGTAVDDPDEPLRCVCGERIYTEPRPDPLDAIGTLPPQEYGEFVDENDNHVFAHVDCAEVNGLTLA